MTLVSRLKTLVITIKKLIFFLKTIAQQALKLSSCTQQDRNGKKEYHKECLDKYCESLNYFAIRIKIRKV